MEKHINSSLKLLALSISLMLINSSLQAQSFLTFDASQNLTNFKFTQSDGTADKNYSGSYLGAYSIGFRHVMDNGLMFRAGLGMRKAGATLEYDASNYSWDLQYADGKLGAGYLFNIGKVNPYLTVSGYFGYLLKANQTLNNEDFDIVNSGSLQRVDYGIIASPGVQITLSEYIAAYVEGNYLMGLRNLETNTNGQKTQNIAYGLTLGVAFAIK